jgi:protein gp37
MENTRIEWSHHTFNPWGGCTQVSEGCVRCYAMLIAEQYRPKDGTTPTHGTWGPEGIRAVRREAYWRDPIKWDRAAQHTGERHRVFCASMADVFEDRDDLHEPRARLFTLIDRTPNLDWLLLTKRPENICRLWEQDGLGLRRENVWLGATAENQRRLDERWPHLQACRELSPVLFLSCEPLLEGVILPGGIDWAIIGGESGHGARPFDVGWVRDFLKQCAILGTTPFVKQSGCNPVGMPRPTGEKNGNGTDPEQWPADIRVRRFPSTRPAPPTSEIEQLRAENAELRRKLEEIQRIVARAQPTSNTIR